LVLYLAISTQFTIKMCVTVQSLQKITETHYFGGSRSFKVFNFDTPKKLKPMLVIISMSLPICNYFHAGWVSGKR